MIRIKRTTYRTIHTDYLRFAVLSWNECAEATSPTSTQPYANRSAIDTIRYSYDCIEAAVEYIYFAGVHDQLKIPIPDTWLTRYLERRWNDLPLSDRLGCMCFAWTGASFWRNNPQLQLFYDLKKLRDGLTHSKPTGKQTESQLSDTGSIPIGEAKLLPSGLLVTSKPIARFSPTPILLSASDAEQALEILLHHLIRMQDVFAVTHTTLFCFYDDQGKNILTTSDLLQKLHCKFSKYWPHDHA